MNKEEAKLNFFVVATPIGNLEDMTFRAVQTLREAELILCEDTRVSRKLLDHYQINTSTISYHQQTGISKLEQIIEKIGQKKNVCLITDAGTPGVSDPGGQLIEKLLETFGESVKISPIPGACAITALASVAGVDLTKFAFWGFPPNKKGRKTFFQQLLETPYPVFYYDSPYRVLKNLKLLLDLGNESIEVIAGRELTKLFEEIRRGRLSEVIAYFENNPGKIKGEFVVIVNNLDKNSR